MFRFLYYKLLIAVVLSAIVSLILFIGCSDDGGGSSPISPPDMGTLSDSLSGTLDPGLYHIVGDLMVGFDDTLRIMPGTTFQFESAYFFQIFGILLAEGIEDDPIVFTMDTVGNPDRWHGLYFIFSGCSGSQLSYCFIENGSPGVECVRSSSTFTNCMISNNRSETKDGGGIFCYDAYPTFINCTISNNFADEEGGGVCSRISSPTFTNCTISGNSSGDYGGGFYSTGERAPILAHCTISGNTSHIGGGVSSSGTFINCIITENSATGDYCYAGGVYGGGTYMNCTISSNSVTGHHGRGGGVAGGGYFQDCTICDNFASDGGEGVHQGGIFDFCIITRNSAIYGGGVLQSEGPFRNCIISYNSANQGGGVYCITGYDTFINCTIVGNTASDCGGGVYNWNSELRFNSTIIAFSDGGGIFFERSSKSRIEYCNIFGNSGVPFQGEIPVFLGDVVTVNVNGDSAGNFRLTEESPCVDAGDPDLPQDPDYTITDIGALYLYYQGAPEKGIVRSR